MKTATRAELQRALKQDQLEPLYLLFAAQAFCATNQFAKSPNTALRGTLLQEFNETTFSLVSEGGQSAIAAAEQLPMMSSRVGL